MPGPAFLHPELVLRVDLGQPHLHLLVVLLRSGLDHPIGHFQPVLQLLARLQLYFLLPLPLVLLSGDLLAQLLPVFLTQGQGVLLFLLFPSLGGQVSLPVQFLPLHNY